MRRKTLTLAVFALALAVAGVAWGEAIELVGPDQAEPGRPFDVAVRGVALPLTVFQSASPPQMEWRVLCGDATVTSRMELRVELDPAGKTRWVVSPYATVLVPKPGKVAVVFFVVQSGVGSLASREVTCGPFPGPNPKPDPKPDPQPNPEPGKRWVILIEETAKRHLHPGLSDLVSEPNWRSYCKSKGHQLRIWDKDLAQTDNAPADARPWFDRAAGKEPRLFIADEAGRVLYEGPPPSPRVAVEFLQKYGG